MRKPGGVRETKRRETHERIAAAGLKLFLERGYEATTLDAIADEAGVSRRTLFYYFDSKDDIVLAWNGAGAVSSAIGPALALEPADSDPLDAARRCLVELASRFEAPESRAVDALMRSSDALRARKDGVFFTIEQSLAEALYTVWPEPGRRPELRATAMLAIGVLRLALDDWRHDNEQRPLAAYIADGFAVLDTVTLRKRAR